MNQSPSYPGRSQVPEDANLFSERYVVQQYPVPAAAVQGIRPLGAPPRVSVVVAARDYGRFLPDCFHSILAQTVKPVEILYADDGSADDSVAIARAFAAHGITTLAFEHRGVVATRNRAVAASTGDFLLHVDGDNMLAPDFIERHLRALADGAAFAYCSKQYFGLSDLRWQPPAWDADRLWLENFVDTSCLVRREVFEAAGGWQETSARTMWDWDLALRMARHGAGVRSDALLFYRHHAENWSSLREGSERHRLGFLKGAIRRAAARLTICTVFSGRVAPLFSRWLEALIESLEPAEREKPEFFVIDDSPQGFWNVAGPHLRQLESCFQALRVVRIHNGCSWEHRRPDRAATARFLSTAYNRLLRETVSELLWFVEDDILVPPGACNQLVQLLLDGEQPQAAVTGLYKSRHEDCYVLSNLDGKRVDHARLPPLEPAGWDLAGTGCLMIFRPLAKAVFHPYWHVPPQAGPGDGRPVGVVPAHDWSFTWQLREKGFPVLSHPHVRCRHYLTEDSWV